VAAVSHARPGLGAAWDHLAARVVVAAGKLTGRALRWSRSVPGIAGAGLMSYGAWLVFRPAGYMVAAAFCLLLDRRL
jgi:hypothetical protein